MRLYYENCVIHDLVIYLETKDFSYIWWRYFWIEQAIFGWCLIKSFEQGSLTSSHTIIAVIMTTPDRIRFKGTWRRKSFTWWFLEKGAHFVATISTIATITWLGRNWRLIVSHITYWFSTRFITPAWLRVIIILTMFLWLIIRFVRAS